MKKYYCVPELSIINMCINTDLLELSFEVGADKGGSWDCDVKEFYLDEDLDNFDLDWISDWDQQ